MYVKNNNNIVQTQLKAHLETDELVAPLETNLEVLVVLKDS